MSPPPTAFQSWRGHILSLRDDTESERAYVDGVLDFMAKLADPDYDKGIPTAEQVDALTRRVDEKRQEADSRIQAIRAEALRRIESDAASGETFGLWPGLGAMLCLWRVAPGPAHLTGRDKAVWTRRQFDDLLDSPVRFQGAVFDFACVDGVDADYADALIGQFYQQMSDSGFYPVQAMRLINMNPAVREVVMGVLRARNLP